MLESNYLSIHHVSLLVADIDLAMHFYQQVLGLQQSTNRPDLGFPGAWFDIGQQQLHLLQLNNPAKGLERSEHVGRDFHFALFVKDINKIIDKLNKEGVNFTRSKSGRQAVFCRDPDNNGIEIIQTT